MRYGHQSLTDIMGRQPTQAEWSWAFRSLMQLVEDENEASSKSTKE